MKVTFFKHTVIAIIAFFSATLSFAQVEFTTVEYNTPDNKSELEKYYSNLGIKYPLHIETIVLTSFKTVLNGERLNHKKIIKPFQLKEKKWEEEDKVRYRLIA